MARAVEDIISSMVTTLETIDPSVDVRKGPIYDLFIRPVAVELASAEERAEHLARLYSLQFADEATDDEVNAFATDVGTGRGEGKAASTRQVFYTTTRPVSTQVIPIQAGTLVGTEDNVVIFRLIDTLSMDGSVADAYFNAASRRYEIAGKVEAVSVGQDVEVAAYRLTKILTPINGIDGTENITSATGGEDAETKDDHVNRLKIQMLGFERGTTGGIVSTTLNIDPENIEAVSFVSSADHQLFERSISEPALDIYVIGAISEEIDETVIALGGETEIVLISQPVTSIGSLSVNGAAVGFEFVEDTDSDTRGSTFALNKIDLDVPLVLNDVVLINYTYNRLIQDVQGDFFGRQLFGTDTLARTPLRIPITVQVELTILASFSESRVLEQAQAVIFDYVEPESFPLLLLPETMRQQLLDQVAGISNATIISFTRADLGRLQVEVVQLEKNEQSFIENTANLVIVRQ